MASLTATHRAYLADKFGHRVTFDPLERSFYGHDIGALPMLIRPIVGDTTPEGVVQPQSEAELAELVRWAYAENIPLTPRGKATSGYGGVVPVRKGLVVDFLRLSRLLSVDEQALTATVEPGITWEQLDRQLRPHNLTLRLYPSSYPSSSVGGWLAQGGAGFGSTEYGYFRDNVISARVVLPSGEVRTFADDELDVISDAEGITGFISQVTLRVQPLEALELVGLACPTAQDVQTLASRIVEAGLPIWSLMFINPRMAEMRNHTPGKTHHDEQPKERLTLPNAYIVTLALRAKDAEAVRAALPELMRASNAALLDERLVRHEWEERFNVMSIKRLGPSLVPAEVIVPLASLAQVMTEIEAKVKQPLVKEGVLVRSDVGGAPEVAILGFIPADERSFSYNLVFGLSLSVAKIAERHGGRPYATGLYFTRRANQVLGRERVERLRAFKAQVDPKGLLNPGKVVGSRLIASALEMASTLEPALRLVGNVVPTQIGERVRGPIRDIPANVAWYAYACSQCGYCVDSCDQFYGRGWESQSPRGKWYWLRQYMEGRAQWNQKMVDTIIACTTCELCNNRCSVSLPIEQSWMQLRGLLVDEKKKMTFPPFEMMAAALRAEGNIWAGYRRNRAAWFPQELLAKHGPQHKARAVYFAGCTASYVEQDIAMASVRLLDAAGVDFTYLGDKESCCATPMLVAGKWDVFAETMKRNIQAVKEAGADTVITSCPACDMMWRQTYPAWAQKLGIEYNLTVRHYSEVVSEKIASGEFAFPASDRATETVTWHDSCHIGRVSGVYEPPRKLIEAIPHANLVEMPFNREEAHCCGSVLTLIKEPPVAAEIGKVRLDEAVEVGAQKVLALCPCCEFQFRVSAEKKGVPVEVVDLAHYAAEALGHKLPDPNPEVQRQWAVFDGMIKLMTPQGFADLMGTMWPELIDAMPFGMGHMMRFIGKLGGAGDAIFAAMKPLFPVLFPILLPMMMPKVMPTMLARVAERIPMPDYMQEQMPDLMPKVMDNLMPHMIGDVVPLVTQPMIDYLRGRA